MKRIYISGPMTGLPGFNRDAFHDAEFVLTNKGFTALNPARTPAGLEYPHYMDISMALIRAAEAIFVLPGWQSSKGAKAEVAYAESLNLPILSEVPHAS